MSVVGHGRAEGRSYTSLSCSRASRLWLEDRQATRRDQKKKKKGSYEGAQGRARQGAEVSRPGMRWEASKLPDPAAAATTALLCPGQQGQAQAEAGSLASQPGAERGSTAGEQAGGPEAF